VFARKWINMAQQLGVLLPKMAKFVEGDQTQTLVIFGKLGHLRAVVV
jgi:hypothetical protein